MDPTWVAIGVGAAANLMTVVGIFFKVQTAVAVLTAQFEHVCADMKALKRGLFEFKGDHEVVQSRLAALEQKVAVLEARRQDD